MLRVPKTLLKYLLVLRPSTVKVLCLFCASEAYENIIFCRLSLLAFPASSIIQDLTTWTVQAVSKYESHHLAVPGCWCQRLPSTVIEMLASLKSQRLPVILSWMSFGSRGNCKRLNQSNCRYSPLINIVLLHADLLCYLTASRTCIMGLLMHQSAESSSGGRRAKMPSLIQDSSIGLLHS